VKVEPDDDYEPYIGERKLRSLGSASDHPRLVASFALALAEVALAFNGNHPGLVLLDEPLQQNPDEAHREQFVETLIRLKGEPRCQAIIFTSLLDEEVAALSAKAVPVTALPGTKLLRSIEGQTSP
jgi:ABC-type nitrate/sulfonate/bicarbonate transport system ATPase subunit